MFIRAVFLLLLVLASNLSLQGCVSPFQQVIPLHQSSTYYNYLQPSFDEYLQQTDQWLAENRSFISDQKQKELAMNMPFQLSPTQPTDKAILLAHGLGDSPYTFSDIAKDLVQMGFHVEVVLLPGHGSQPEHLMEVEFQDWQNLVDHYAKQLKQNYSQVWLGGFSTGANLVTINAIEQGNVDGLLLFSPGFQSKAHQLEKLTPVLATFMDWGWQAEEDNLAKYSSKPLQAAIAYSDSADYVRSLLKDKTVTIPTLIVLSEHDSVVDPNSVRELFTQGFEHPNSRLIWYGESSQANNKVIRQSMLLPDQHISSASHMGVTFKPSNPYYGVNGEKKVCRNNFNEEEKALCEQGAEVWYAAWGHEEEDKIHARLTWNPHYETMLKQIANIVRNSSPILFKQVKIAVTNQ